MESTERSEGAGPAAAAAGGTTGDPAGETPAGATFAGPPSRYSVPDWVRVRREDFGLLFYDIRSTRLTYARSGDDLEPPPFTGAQRSLRIAPVDEERRAALARLLDGLVAKGLLTGGEPAGRRARPDGRGSGEAGAQLADAGAPAEGAGALTSLPLRAPVNVTWEITEACNLHCSHCLSAGLREPGGPGAAPSAGRRELDLSACRALLDELARMQVFQVNFGGGEPFLRDDLLEILRYAHSRGITTCVSTNGTVLDDALVDELLRMQPVYLQVSLDGACAATNDAIRGEGTFARILAGVELLAGRGYPDFSLNMVVTRPNAGEIAAFDRLARSYGAKTRLSRFRPSGRGCTSWQDYRLTREQLLELSTFLGDHPEILTGDSFFALTPESRRKLGLNMCGAAKMTCAVAPTGDVYPCAFLCDAAFLAGNVTSQPLSALFGSSPVFARLRDLEVGSCRSCDRFSLCHGGCPAIGYFLTDSLGLPDPECLRAAMSAKEEVE